MTKKKNENKKDRKQQKREAADDGAPVELHVNESPEAEEKPDPQNRQSAESAEEVEDRLKAEQKELMDKLARMQADFENYRKRAARERIQIEALATEELMKELLPVADHFEMALKYAKDHETEESVVEGFEMVLGQLITAMGKHGLETIDADEGEFDPAVHEAVAHIPCEEVPENSIVEQTRKGYKLGNKIIRAAEVVVSSGKLGA